jgi:hypothetical protein
MRKLLLTVATSCLLTVGAHAANEKKPPPPVPAPGEEVSEEFFDYLNHKIGFDCQKALKSMVKYDIRTPGMLWGTNQGDWAFMRFDRWSKYVSPDNTIRIRGDDAELQNGLGNWVRHTYSCTVHVDPSRIWIVDTNFNPGKMP